MQIELLFAGIALMLSFILGVMSWRNIFGRIVVIGCGVLLLLLCTIFVLYYQKTKLEQMDMKARMMAEVEQTRLLHEARRKESLALAKTPTSRSSVNESPALPAPRLQFRFEASESSTMSWQALPCPDGGETGSVLRVQTDILFNESDVASAKLETDVAGRQNVLLTFQPDAQARFAEITAKNLGRRLAIVFDGRVLSAPVIQAQITGGQAVISGPKESEVAELVKILSSAGSPPRDSKK
jgi:preprotein translocase subunit SecD